MPHAPRPLPASLPFAVFSTQEALALGVDVTRLRRDDLRSLAPGFWARRDRVVTEREIVGALCRKDPRAFAAGLTAARLWGFPLPGSLADQVVEAPTMVRASTVRPGRGPGRKRIDRRIHMARPGSQRRPTALLRWSRFDGEVARIRDRRGDAPTVRLTSRVQTFLHLGAVLRVGALVAIGDHLVRRPRPDLENGRTEPWCTIAELREQCTGRHAAALSSALDAVRVGADSPRETLLRLAFARAGLPEPFLNVPLIAPDGTELHEPDFQWPAHRVCAEYDGRTHSTPDQVSKDIRRARRAAAAGWVEVRLHTGDVERRCAPAIEQVRAALAAREQEGGQGGR